MKLIKGIFWFTVILSPLIIIHELSHLLVGQWVGLHPESFSLGFGPVLYSWFWQGIEWKISAIPLGGYVSFPQETMLMIGEGKSGAWLITALVGPGSNLLLAYGLMFGWFKTFFKHSKFVKDSQGTLFFRGQANKFFSRRFATQFFKISNNQEINLVSAEEVIAQPVTAETDYNFTKLCLQNAYRMTFGQISEPFLQVIRLVTLQNQQLGSNRSLMGPLGIGQVLSEAARHSPARVVLLMAHVSFSLGVFNLLPLGALDGGKALQAILQGIFQVNPQSMMMYQIISFAVIVGLLTWALGADIWTIFKNQQKPQ